MYTYTYAVYVTCGEKSANSPESSCLCLIILRHLWAYQTIPATPPKISWGHQITHFNTTCRHLANNTEPNSLRRERKYFDKQLYSSPFSFLFPIPADVRSEVTQSSLYKFLECFFMIGAPGNLVGPLKQDKLDPERPTPPRPPGITSLNRNHRMDCSSSNY